MGSFFNLRDTMLQEYIGLVIGLAFVVIFFISFAKEKSIQRRPNRRKISASRYYLFGIELLNLYDTRISAFVLDYHSLDLVQKVFS